MNWYVYNTFIILIQDSPSHTFYYAGDGDFCSLRIVLPGISDNPLLGVRNSIIYQGKDKKSYNDTDVIYEKIKEDIWGAFMDMFVSVAAIKMRHGR